MKSASPMVDPSKALYRAPAHPDLGTFPVTETRHCPCQCRRACSSCNGSGLLYGARGSEWEGYWPIAVVACRTTTEVAAAQHVATA